MDADVESFSGAAVGFEDGGGGVVSATTATNAGRVSGTNHGRNHRTRNDTEDASIGSATASVIRPVIGDGTLSPVMEVV